MKKCDLRVRLRELWEEHVVWTRNVIFCLVHDMPGTEQAVDRLMQNQTDMGDAVKPFFGDAAGDELTVLLKEHIAIAAEVVKAAVIGDTVLYNSEYEKWVKNADEISVFLSGALTELDCYEMGRMMREHLEVTAIEAKARIESDFDRDIFIDGKIHEYIREMSDHIYDAIVKQFPEKFEE